MQHPSQPHWFLRPAKPATAPACVPPPREVGVRGCKANPPRWFRWIGRLEKDQETETQPSNRDDLGVSSWNVWRATMSYPYHSPFLRIARTHQAAVASPVPQKPPNPPIRPRNALHSLRSSHAPIHPAANALRPRGLSRHLRDEKTTFTWPAWKCGPSISYASIERSCLGPTSREVGPLAPAAICGDRAC